jgi:hypothetical protein
MNTRTTTPKTAALTIGIDPTLLLRAKLLAHVRGVSVSKLVGDLLEQATSGLDDELRAHGVLRASEAQEVAS